MEMGKLRGWNALHALAKILDGKVLYRISHTSNLLFGSHLQMPVRRSRRWHGEDC